MANLDEKLRVKIDAHVVQQLGAELITSPAIALLELIKNAHDADATYCYIDIDTKYVEKIDNNIFIGKVTVKDNGHGMQRDAINRSWLTVSYSAKRAAKIQNLKTNRNRTFTGDKGLGRLGSMQLAPICRISTFHTAGESGLQVSFSWNDFQHGRNIDDVPVKELVLAPQKTTGTTLEIIGLHDLSFWQDSSNQKDLAQRVASMISPHGQIQNFNIYFRCDGIDYETTELSELLLKQSASNFSFKVDSDRVTINGQLDLLSYRPSANQADQIERYEKFITSDNGLSLASYLSNSNALQEYKIKHKEGKYVFYFEFECLISDISETKKSYYLYPGDFSGKIFNFIFRKDSLDLKSVSSKNFDSLIETIQDITGGISAYRDGFRIGSGRIDWLNLSKEMTSGSGSYSLRPSNITGFINLTWDENRNLIEKSDRESFVENKEYKTFFILSQFIIKKINDYLNKSRRISLIFLKEMTQNEVGKPKGYSARLAAKEINQLSVSGKQSNEKIIVQIEKSKKEFESKRKDLNEKIERSKDDLFSDPRVTLELEKLNSMVADLEMLVNVNQQELQSFTKELSSYQLSSEQILSEIDGYERQIKNFYDYVAIGLSAQALAHEANSQITNIRLHLNLALQRLKDLKIKDIPLIKELNSIQADTQVISKSISSLSPLVRAQREKTDSIIISEYVEEYVNLRKDYFLKDEIDIKASTIEGDNCLIKFNRGKLFQIIDNITRNSEHWLKLSKIHYPNEILEIKFSIHGYKIVISDSGKGIREPLEDVLFDMFSTDKEDGQGLGLFIVKMLLDERGCSVKLLHDRNKHGRRFKFEIDLTEAAI
ncbi:hypothetical protein F0T03_03065 [Yersinia canariae]|uniref:Histidine kinase domain-containing protein n=1 Tax=Yersinia canariae TaxID=2607663 RepID=A0A857EXN5_9GAMM|nr:sensor histidine kinase [Yersinia canariae]QHB31269.1 hypothetical protein F0T03_03065 [Yersinia canariae]